MPSSVSHPNRDRTPPTPQISDSFFDDDDDDDEEEEEEEEEEDVEEEEDGDDAEEEGEEEELEENESDLPYKADDGDDRQDARVDVKSQRPGGSFGSGSSSRGDKKDVGSISKKSSSTQCKNPNPDGNDVLSNSQILNPKTSNSSGADGKETVATMRKNDFVGRNDVPYSYCEMKQMDLQSGDDRKRILSRSTSSEIETRSLPPGAEIKDQNKRPAIVCDFYAKGWCIKGSSCRFLHVKDLQKNNLPQGEGGVAADCKREVQLEGLKETTQRARMPDEPLASSFGNKSLLSSHFSSQRIQPLEHIESNTSRHLPEMPKFPTLHRDGSFPLTFPLSFGDRLGPEYAVSSSHRFMTPSSHSRSMGELASVQSQHSYSYLPLSPLNHPPNSSSSNSLLATGMLSSNRVSAWTGSLLPFSYSSLNASHLGSRPSSLLQSSSHVSGLGPDDLNSTVSKISSNDWEPSAPFRPSFLLRSLITCPGSQYDPLRDSVELPKVGEISLKASLHSQGSSIVNTTHQKNNGHVVSETRVLAGNDETMSVSSHNTNHGKDMQATEVEDVRTIDWKHRNASKRENSLGSSAVKDTTLATGDGRHRRLGPRDGVDAKVDGLRQKNKMDAGHIIEGGADKESKALRQFRAALIDSVKESLKPKWREGYLSKDAHNKIVKKAVEKVLSTMQPEQVPTSTELVVQYLAASRPKIDKLVEGYTEKYGKL